MLFSGADRCFSQDYFMEKDSSAILTPPVYPNGGDAFNRNIHKIFRIPQSIGKFSYKGTFYMKLTVNADGETILDSINFDKMSFGKKKITQNERQEAMDDLTKEMKRVFERLPLWTPAMSKGVPVSAKFNWSYHINFDE